MIDILLAILTVLLGVIAWLLKRWIALRDDWYRTKYAELSRAIDIGYSRQNSANTHIDSVEHQVIALKGQVIRHDEMLKQTAVTLGKLEDSVKPIIEIKEKVAVIHDRLEKRA